MIQTIKKFLDSKLLFYTTIVFILCSFAFGLFLDCFFESQQDRFLIAGIVGLFLVTPILYLIFAYTYKIVVVLKLIHAKKGNLFLLYRKDKIFKTSINKSASCLFILINTFVNFVASFTSFKWYFLSTALIFFLIFSLQLYLISNIENSTKKQNEVVAYLTIFMAIVCLGIVVLLAANDTGFSPKGLIIFWDALYVFVTFITAVVGTIQAIKRKDHIIGRFLVVKLANAIFGMFTLTVTMLMTFSEEYSQIGQFSIIVGIVSSFLIIAIAIVQLVLFKKFTKTEILE